MRGNILVENGDFKMQQAAAAVIAGVTTNTLIMWEKGDNPPPRNDDGSYSARNFSAYMMRRAAEKAAPKQSMPGVDESRDQAETRLKRAQADKIEMDNEVSRGNLVSMADVELAWSRILVRVKTGFLSLPSKFSAELAREKEAHEVQAILQTAIRDVLSELSEDWRDEDAENDDEDE